MSTPEQQRAATIHVVSPGADGDNTGAPPVKDPDAAPPITAPPPQELQPDLGGAAAQTPSADQMVEAEGGGVADQLRARWEGMAATEEFSVPGWEMPDGSPGLILVARTFGDRKAWNTTGIPNEVFIARSTHQLLFVKDDGTRKVIEGGWGPALAQMIGVSVAKAADLVALVISKPDPNQPTVRIPNVAGIGSLAMEIVAWSRKSYREAEEDLGG